MENSAERNRRFDNIHPGLSQADALAILRQPEHELDAASDYYMAAAHLINFPGRLSEQALIDLVECRSDSQALRLARRKAVEVLARLGAVQAIPSIGDCLHSDDPYLIENAAWALQQLNCDDPGLLRLLGDRLRDCAQCRRVLIKALTALDPRSALAAVEPFLTDENPGVRGAAIAAVAILSGDRSGLQQLEQHLTLPNQMDRQTAIQDLIDSGGGELMPAILKAPVSPVFRIRALRQLWPAGFAEFAGLHLLDSLDALLLDRPEQLELVHCYDSDPSDAFLVQEFFGTDFSRSYLALATLQQRAPDQIWPQIWQRWQLDAHNDYGAHYFVIQLLAAIECWPDHCIQTIRQLLWEAVNSLRPQFSKSRLAALHALRRHDPDEWIVRCLPWFSSEHTPNWEMRYAAWMGLQTYPAEQIAACLARVGDCVDPDPIVELRRQLLISA